jgi:uncharacterized membrane protein
MDCVGVTGVWRSGGGVGGQRLSGLNAHISVSRSCSCGLQCPAAAAAVMVAFLAPSSLSCGAAAAAATAAAVLAGTRPRRAAHTSRSGHITTITTSQPLAAISRSGDSGGHRGGRGEALLLVCQMA